MGLAALDAALSGLRVSQQQINVISNNVANVNTPGFSRKILPQSSQALEGVTVGVASETIIRQVDLNLSRDLWTQVSRTGELNIERAYQKRIEQFHGPPDAELSIAAEVTQLRNSFATLSDTPEDSFLLRSTVRQAENMANKFNDFADLITTLRNDAQADLENNIDRINSLLEQIAELNNQVQDNLNISRSTAQTEDQRDEAIKELADLIDISFFVRGDGVLVVQTNQGIELASERANRMIFNPTPLSAANFYPDSAAGIYVVDQDFSGDPTTSSAAFEITDTEPGGQVGALLALRDEILPRQTAQLDELAHKMALRFQAQGLTLFTDSAGVVPTDTAPDPTAGPPALAVEYVGFASQIQVNDAVLADNTLIQRGTVPTDLPVPVGSNEVIRRVIEFTFGDVFLQEATQAGGNLNVDIRAAATGGTTLQDWLGIRSENRIISGVDIQSIGPDLITSPASPFPTGNDTFSITIDPGAEGPGPVTFNVDLNAIPPAGNATAADLAAFIDGLSPDIQASLNANGQLVIESRWDLAIDATTPPNAMGQAGLNFLGLAEGTFDATDPYFDVQVGNDPPTRITIEPGDTEVELLAKLEKTSATDFGVPGLAVNIDADGNLELRPGDDFANPNFGGDIKITPGPFEVNIANAAIETAPPGVGVGPGAIEDGINIVSALFGSFTPAAGGNPALDRSPVSPVLYGSETDASNPGTFLPFRETLLGPGLNLSTGIVGVRSLEDYAQRIVNGNGQAISLLDNRIADEESLRDLLQRQLLDESGVNIDEELSRLIVQQTAFAAAARVVTAVDQSFQELLNAV